MVLTHPKHDGDSDGDGDFSDDSGCSTPYVSAPSSPGLAGGGGGGGGGPCGYFFSAPASPMHFLLSSTKEHHRHHEDDDDDDICSASEAFLAMESSGSFEFEFSSRFSPAGSNPTGLKMSSADELFLDGQIRPMKLSSHLQRPQILAPLMDLDGEDEEEEAWSSFTGGDQISRGRDLRARNRSMHRKARSLSPLRSGVELINWHANDVKLDDAEEEDNKNKNKESKCNETETETETETASSETTPSCSASSSRSSSSGRNSKKWIFLKDLLRRSKSEGRANTKERFWSNISFSPAKRSPELTPSSSRDEKDDGKPSPEKMKRKGRNKLQGLSTSSNNKSSAVSGKPANGVSKRRVPRSAHELHYTANRAQAEEMKKKTFLPYRQGLLGCLGFSSKGYGALNGLTKSLNPISSR